jgi:hypothetical protein
LDEWVTPRVLAWHADSSRRLGLSPEG